MRFNRETFFNGYRQNFGRLDQSQVDGLNFLVDKLESDTFSLTQASYVLATVKHETASTFQPIKEKRGRAGTRIRQIQDRYWSTGAYGRGYVQLTWPKNYEKFGMSNPDDYDLALKPEKAYEILSVGMRDGLFTGKKLSDYVNDEETDYHDARRVVNGVDRAADIAAIATKFERVLSTALLPDEAPKAIEIPATDVPVVVQAPAVQTPSPTPVEGGGPADPPKPVISSLWSRVYGGIAALGGALAAVKGWLNNHDTVLAAGIICITLICLALIFRKAILDYLRMQINADPNKINVK